MDRRAVGLCVAIGVLTPGTAHAVAAKAAPDRCVRPGRTQDRRTAQVRIFTKVADAEEGSGTTYACVRGTGRVTPLYDTDGKDTTGSVAAIRGRWVAFVTDEGPGCGFSCPEGATSTVTTTVVDARTGRRRVLSTTGRVVLRLRDDGVVAWLEGPQLSVWDRDGRRSVATGTIDTVAYVDGALTWRNDGVPGQAEVRGIST